MIKKEDLIVEEDLLLKYFKLHYSDLNNLLRKNVRVDYVYKVFSNKQLPRYKKKEYLYSCSCSELIKDNLWERYIGDKGYGFNNFVTKRNNTIRSESDYV